jgi:hypothetical protein
MVTPRLPNPLAEGSIPSGPALAHIAWLMADQSDLVEVIHTLHQVLNYKGT